MDLLSHVLFRRCELDGRVAGGIARKLVQTTQSSAVTSRAIGQGGRGEVEVEVRRGEVGEVEGVRGRRRG